MKNLGIACSGAALLALFACGGGGGGTPAPKTATGLAYADPTGDYRLVKDAALSSSTRLVLDVVGPASIQGRGLCFTFTVDPRATLAKVADGDGEYVENGTVFQLGPAPQLLKGIQKDGSVRVSLSQKGAGNGRLLNGVLARVAVQFSAGAGLTAGTTIPVSVTGAMILPATGEPQAITIASGSLTAQ